MNTTASIPVPALTDRRLIRYYTIGFALIWWFWMFQSVLPYASLLTAIILSFIYALAPSVFGVFFYLSTRGITRRYKKFISLFLFAILPWAFAGLIYGMVFGFLFGILFSFFVDNSSDRVVAYIANPIGWSFVTLNLGWIMGAILGTERRDKQGLTVESISEYALEYHTNGFLEGTITPISKIPLGWLTAAILLFFNVLFKGEMLVIIGIILGAVLGLIHGKITEQFVAKLLSPELPMQKSSAAVGQATGNSPNKIALIWGLFISAISIFFWISEGATMGGFIGHAFSLRENGSFTLPMPFLFWTLDNQVYNPADRLSQQYGVDFVFVYRVGAHVGLFGASIDIVRIVAESVIRRFVRP
jgi:MFS family permease